MSKRRTRENEKSRLFALLLAVTIGIGMLPLVQNPLVAKASPASGMELGAAKITASGKWDKNNGVKVYFGKNNGNPILWRVLYKTSFPDCAILDADTILYEAAYQNSTTESPDWGASNLRYQLESRQYEWFSEKERKQMLYTFLEGRDEYECDNSRYKDAESMGVLFLLSAYDANEWYADNEARKKGGNWWLRSVDTIEMMPCMGSIDASGSLYSEMCIQTGGVSPSFTLDLGNILFTRMVEANTYKLTLLDSEMEIFLQEPAKWEEDTLSVSYELSGNAGNAEVYLMILDKEYTTKNENGAKLINYERLTKTDYGDGSYTSSFSLTEELKNHPEYKYYLVSETEENGNATNYASKPYCLTGEQPADNAEESSSQEHVCSFSWVVIKDVSLWEDGIEEYRCACGNVKERVMIPASEYYIKQLYGKIRFAQENGTVQFEAGSFHTISDYLLTILQKRQDVTLILKFEYRGTAYEAQFTPGTDYTELLQDKEQFYGLLGMNGKFGITVKKQQENS